MRVCFKIVSMFFLTPVSCLLPAHSATTTTLFAVPEPQPLKCLVDFAKDTTPRSLDHTHFLVGLSNKVSYHWEKSSSLDFASGSKASNVGCSDCLLVLLSPEALAAKLNASLTAFRVKASACSAAANDETVSVVGWCAWSCNCV